MKLLLILLLFPFLAIAQHPGYTKRFTKEEVLSFAVDNSFHTAAGGATPSLNGGWPGAGALYVDSVNHILYFYSGATWHATTSGGGLRFGVATEDFSAAQNRDINFHTIYNFIFDSVNTYLVTRNGQNRDIINGSVSQIFSPNGTNYLSASNAVTTMAAGANLTQISPDSTLLTKRASYTTNLGSSFTNRSLVDKNYVDSVAAISPGSVTSIATSSPITGGTITSTGTIGIANAAADGTTKGAATFTAADFNATTGLISLDYTNGQAASGSAKGYLTSTDWTTFNNKGSVSSVATGYGLSGGTITTTGTLIADSSGLALTFLRRKDSATSTYNGYITKKILADTAAAIRSAIGAVPTLQDVTDAGNFTTNTVSSSGGLETFTPYAGVNASLAYSGNGTNAQGVLTLSDWSTTGLTGGNFISLQTVQTVTGGQILQLPDESDTLATHQWVLAHAGGGGGGNTIYTADDALASDRTVDLNGKVLILNDISTNNASLEINPQVGSSAIIGTANDPTGDGNSGIFIIGSTPTQGTVSLATVFNGGATTVGIIAMTADATNTRNEYTADTHTFTGNVLIGTGLSPAPGQIFVVYDNTANAAYISVDTVNYATDIRGSDGLANAELDLSGKSGTDNSYFELVAGDGFNSISILGDPTAQTITLTAANGVIIDGVTYPLADGAAGQFITTNGSGTATWANSGGITSHNISTPTTGGTVNLVNNQYNIINPSGTLLALTVNLPSTPSNNDVVYIKYTKSITTVTYGNGTVVDGIASPVGGGFMVLSYDAGTTSWY